MSLIESPVVRRVLSSPLLGALTWPHGVERYVEAIGPRWSLTEGRGLVTGVNHQTPDTVTLTIEPNRTWQGHRSGQHVEVGVEIDGVVLTRCYSVVTSEAPRGTAARSSIELTVKAHPEGRVSNHLVRHAAPGMVLRLSNATGDFTLPAGQPSRLVLISGGSGITPVMSMLRTLCDTGDGRPVTFVHYSFGSDDALYADEVTELTARHSNVNRVRAYTDATNGDLSGLFSEAHLDGADPRWREAEVFVCGPTGLMDAVEEIVHAAGRGDHLHTERFQLVPVVTEADLASATGTLTFATSGQTVANSGSSVLDQAESAGLTPNYGCRMGICHTCTRPKTSGCVRNLLTGELSELGAHDVQVCISAPVGDVVIDL